LFNFGSKDLTASGLGLRIALDRPFFEAFFGGRVF
jgi:hypothetical protein